MLFDEPLALFNGNPRLVGFGEYGFGCKAVRPDTGRPGLGTFINRTLADPSLAAHEALRSDLVDWLTKARRAGLDDDSIAALFDSTFRSAAEEGVA